MKTNSKSNTSSVQVINYDYNGNRVTFNVNGKIMINASQMAHPFGKAKQPALWLRLQSSKDFLEALVEQKFKLHISSLPKNQPITKPADKLQQRTLFDTVNFADGYKSYYKGLVITQRGGANPGTWFHEDVALEFARWLSPAFAIWCNERIKEILQGKNQLSIDNSFAETLKIELQKIPDRYRNAQEIYSKKSGINLSHVISDLIPFIWAEGQSLESNLMNYIAITNNNMISSLYYLSRRLKLETELETEKRKLRKIVEFIQS